MLRLTLAPYTSWMGRTCKNQISVLFLSILQQTSFYSSEKQNDKQLCHVNISDHKLWKRVSKNDPAMLSIIKSSEAQHRISQLADVMECGEPHVTELIKRDSILVVSNTVLEKIVLLKNNGFSSDDIISNPSVLHRSFLVLKKRLESAQALHSPITLHAMGQSNKNFERFIQKLREECEAMEGFTSRSSFLAHLFDCDETEVADLIADNTFLESVSPALIKRKADILVKHKIPRRFLKENMRITVHISVSELDRRLALLRKEHLLSNPDLKLGYLLSCRRLEFSKSFDYLYKRKKALEGCKDKVEYVVFRLHCDEPSAKIFLGDSTISETKLKECLDFFLEELNVSPDFVLRNRQLLMFSVKRLRERWAVLSDAGYSISELSSAAALSQKKFAKKFGSSIYIDTFKSADE